MRETFGRLGIEEVRVISSHVLKLRLPFKILDSGLFVYTTASSDTDSLLARLLFEVRGVYRVVITPSTVAISFAGGTEKSAAKEGVCDAIREFFDSGRLAIDHPRLYSYRKATGQEQRAKEQEVQEFLDLFVNPFLVMHGGKLVLMGVREKQVFFSRKGCEDTALLDIGISERMKELVPWVDEIIDVTENEFEEDRL